MSDNSRKRVYENITKNGSINKKEIANYVSKLFGSEYDWYIKLDLAVPEMVEKIILQITIDREYFNVKEQFNEKSNFYYYMIEICNFIRHYGYVPYFNDKYELIGK